jgi:peptide-methionine (R)-S-oxide reductase
MKYLLFSIMMLACNAPQSNKVVAPGVDAAPATDKTTMTHDTIVPPQYDANGKLVKLVKTNEDWKSQLNAEEYEVLRKEGTERAFTGDQVNNHEKGVFTCAACGLPLFSSDAKFESGTGWPSFFQPIKPEYITVNTDTKYGMVRDEIECARCGGHQGHVFEDGPKPTGLRYCINSVSLNFVKQ